MGRADTRPLAESEIASGFYLIKRGTIPAYHPEIARRVRLMAYYRLYFFDDQCGHIINCRQVEAEHDAAAIAFAERWWWGGPIELWHDAIKVKAWPTAPLSWRDRTA